MSEKRCPICDEPTESFQEIHDFVFAIQCVRCGRFEMPRETIDDLPGYLAKFDKEIWTAKISHALRRMQENGHLPRVTLENLKCLNKEREFPSPPEQGDNLISCVGDDLLHQPGEYSRWQGNKQLELVARIGARKVDDVWYVTQQLESHGLIETASAMSNLRVRLTFNGWQHYEKLKREVVESRTAFMAMPFGEERLRRIYRECFRPAVKTTGFVLRRLDEDAPAGSIINRLRVEIRRARFLLAELSTNNAGTYWEAGFAEGLGRPVIYTCEEGRGTHFDTRQLLTVFWSEGDLESAAQQLKDTIRATLPTEALLSDPKE